MRQQTLQESISLTGFHKPYRISLEMDWGTAISLYRGISTSVARKKKHPAICILLHGTGKANSKQWFVWYIEPSKPQLCNHTRTLYILQSTPVTVPAEPRVDATSSSSISSLWSQYSQTRSEGIKNPDWDVHREYHPQLHFFAITELCLEQVWLYAQRCLCFSRQVYCLINLKGIWLKRGETTHILTHGL